jgi:hypothetical protein
MTVAKPSSNRSHHRGGRQISDDWFGRLICLGSIKGFGTTMVVMASVGLLDSSSGDWISMLRPLGYERTGRGLSDCDRSHMCRQARAGHSAFCNAVAPDCVASAMFCSRIRSRLSNPRCHWLDVYTAASRSAPHRLRIAAYSCWRRCRSA